MGTYFADPKVRNLHLIDAEIGVGASEMKGFKAWVAKVKCMGGERTNI